MAVNHIPEGYHSVTPYLIVDGAAEAIRFYGEAFGAVEVLRMPMGAATISRAMRSGMAAPYSIEIGLSKGGRWCRCGPVMFS